MDKSFPENDSCEMASAHEFNEAAADALTCIHAIEAMLSQASRAVNRLKKAAVVNGVELHRHFQGRVEELEARIGRMNYIPSPDPEEEEEKITPVASAAATNAEEELLNRPYHTLTKKEKALRRSLSAKRGHATRKALDKKSPANPQWKPSL